MPTVGNSSAIEDKPVVLGARPGFTITIGKDLIAEIPTAPFANLFLLLIAITALIVGMLDIPPGFQIEFGECRSCSHVVSLVPRHQVKVVIARTGRIMIDGAPTTLTSLYQDQAHAIDSHKRRGESARIALLADTDVAWYYIIKVFDAGRQAGDEGATFVSR